MALSEAEELELLELEAEAAQSSDSTHSAETDTKPITKGLLGSSVGENSPVLKGARVPEQVISGTARAMMDAIEPETTSVPLNAAIRFPQTLASMGAEGVASTLSPESAVMSAAGAVLPMLAKPINAVGKFIGNTAEKMSGLSYRTPGVLAETVKDPSLMYGPGLDKARAAYKSIQNVNQISPDLQRISQPRAFVRKALEFADNGNLTPDEALEARKALDSISDSVPDVYRNKTRAVFDAIAKTKFEKADKAYSRAVKSDALRNFWGINKGQTPSLLKQGISLAYPVTGAFFSPFAQGNMAAGVGRAKQVALPLLKNPVPTAVGLERFRRRKTDNK